MPIKFTVHEAEGYFLSEWTGKLTDQEIMNDWIEFLNGPQWRPGLNELADVSRADISKISSAVVKKLADYTRAFYEKRDVGRIKAAVFAPKRGQFGMSRMYAAWSGESPESIRVFDDIAEAKAWLQSG